MRYPYAAKTLFGQIRAEHPKATMTAADDPDGFGVVRSVMFSKTASEQVIPMLEALVEMKDPRLVGVREKQGQAVVTFSAGPAADSREPFPMSAARDDN